ncbi:transcriptional regulator, LacI family [Hungatella hathewayi DSM 13479]|jgi:LacI family transcriptional regulator|uniref:Transcriptional regulator, LacI family n=2 Tax=Hungatella hathewayi TaxID=154046 RepID=D3A9K9_9FIRM|nr:transcriptional regulator, LacI family [Hungatella hathewayi DSM 13479]
MKLVPFIGFMNGGIIMAQLTISDIAKKAGVSKATVSRVLNNNPNVKDETREKVLAIMQAKGYSPSAAARSLSKQTSDTIGVIVPEIDNPFFGRLLRGVIDVMGSYNLSMICCNTDDTISKDLESLDMLNNHRVRGLIYTPATDYSIPQDKLQLKKMLQLIDAPVVQIDRMVSGINADCILFRDEEGVYQATQMLIQAGHKKIGIINATLDQYLARIRQKGFIRAMEEARLPVEERYQFFGNYRMSKAYELAKEMLAMPDRPTAVITCNNNTTLGLLKALHERNETIPESLSCIGLDSIEVLKYTGNNFNFIERDSYAMGREAMELLIKRIAFPDMPKRTIYLDTSVVIHKL